MTALTIQQESNVYTLAAQMMAETDSDADRARIDRALDLVAGVQRMADRPDLFLVVSATVADAAYRVHQGQCNCPDASKRDARRCKHAAAVALFQRLERAEVDAEQAAATIAGGSEPEMYTADTHPQYNRKCRRCGSTIIAGTKHWSINGAESGFECWQCPLPAPAYGYGFTADPPEDDNPPMIAGGSGPLLAIRVDPEDSILDLWPGEPCDLPPQCPRCHTEPAIARHPDRLGRACISAELFGEVN